MNRQGIEVKELGSINELSKEEQMLLTKLYEKHIAQQNRWPKTQTHEEPNLDTICGRID